MPSCTCIRRDLAEEASVKSVVSQLHLQRESVCAGRRAHDDAMRSGRTGVVVRTVKSLFFPFLKSFSVDTLTAEV